MQRRLAAIFVADVAGYSRLMGDDERGTLAALKANRAAIEALIAAGEGRLVKTTGDGLLAEFPSVVAAVEAAVAIQAAVTERGAAEPEARRQHLRIGIHLGDVIVDEGDIYGDGVNIAARLQELAEPGGVALSRIVADSVRGKVAAALVDAGEQALKNIAVPMQVFRIAPAAAPAPAKTLPLPDKPSLAVLPFQNLSGDPEQEYFADGMVEDITTALSRVKEFFVIARNSAFAYKGKSIDVKRVGRELGVRYLVEGSVRRVGDRVRITGQLIDAATGAHLWADRYDGALADVFELQDRVTASVVGAIEPSLQKAEIERAGRKPTASLAAYDLTLQAIGASRPYNRENTARALELTRKAIVLDPRYALAHSWIAFGLSRRKLNDWMIDEETETAEGVRAAHLAVPLAPDDPSVLANAGFALALLNGDVDTAIPWLDRAIALNPNSAIALGLGATVRNFAGDYGTAADHAMRAKRLSPFDPLTFAWDLALGISHLYRRDLVDSISWLKKSTQANPLFASAFYFLACALAHVGRLDEAQAAMARMLELRPGTTVAWQRRRRAYLERDVEYALEGARLAGLPE